MTRPDPSISDLVADRRPGHSLPAGLYTRADVFDADMEIFFRNHWIAVGLECDVPEPGDAYVLDIGKSSLILLRDDEGEIRVLHNVCRHRGARVLNAGNSIVSKLVCPYHQWTYELSGELMHAPHMGQGFDKSCRSLKPVKFVSVGGLVYACLSDNPPEDIDRLIETMEPRLAPYDIRNAKVAYQCDVIENGNWKLTIENNRECYHCLGNHPELCLSFIDLDFGYDPAALSQADRERADAHEARFAEVTMAWEAAGYPSAAVLPRVEGDTNFRTQRLLMNGAGESQSPDTRAACKKLLGTMTDKMLGDVHLWGHNTWNHFMADHAVIATVIPLGPDRTLVRTKWLVHKDAVEGVDYDVQHLTSVWVATTDQDAELVERSHAGVSDPAYEPGPYSEFAETELESFAGWYVRQMRVNGY
ncbi:Rieske (2Fe-2S) domain protein [Novosphingobium nitrogenifigens DSM 19370]|uniref:Rieske (2Fe-2S) domain protein n=1 Tax=Novosphingobium nitrogenifigens DSM 19370 TaxID=983920 RepID=F1ZBV5_9SPHN|nr:aromatic ring-hydroxylating dioxygenase subunit alpha [Novosphingobium nitrogenifigens]EGD57969.1 Rieske (2Fe-2S) domain protein [Novosphingobium nitrogenifigens DSM 19370]